MTRTTRRRVANWAAFFVTWGTIGFGAYQAVNHPDTPLPDHWNPTKPLQVTAPYTALTGWKFRMTQSDRASCLDALAAVATFDRIPDKEVSDQCHIRNQVVLRDMVGVKLPKTETRCDLALTTAMWLQHGVKPAAEKHFGQEVSNMRTQGSYNCRTIAGSSRWSQHAQAKALDVAGFTLDDGTRIELLQDWFTDTAAANFLKDTRDSSCDWFKTTLGPEYNRAHADHFHLQTEGWGTCR